MEVSMAYVIMKAEDIVHVLVLNHAPASDEEQEILALFGGDRLLKVTCDAADEVCDIIFAYNGVAVSC